MKIYAHKLVAPDGRFGRGFGLFGLYMKVHEYKLVAAGGRFGCGFGPLGSKLSESTLGYALA